MHQEIKKNEPPKEDNNNTKGVNITDLIKYTPDLGEYIKANILTKCGRPRGYEGKYKFAGTADAIINSNENKLKILDFKQSNKPKRREYSVINEYGLQLALYSIAHDSMFGTQISSTEILMCTPNLIFQNFEFKGEEFENLKMEAMNRVEQYYNQKNLSSSL